MTQNEKLRLLVRKRLTSAHQPFESDPLDLHCDLHCDDETVDQILDHPNANGSVARIPSAPMDSRPSLVDIELCPRILNAGQPEPTLKTRGSFVARFLHSFKPQERASPLNDTAHPVEGDTSPLNRALKGRHLQFIAIGGSIGAGLFIGCGKALAIGGPGWLLVAFSVVGIMLLCVMHALGELAAIYPISGIYNRTPSG